MRKAGPIVQARVALGAPAGQRYLLSPEQVPEIAAFAALIPRPAC